jgi:hypothetical protein
VVYLHSFLKRPLRESEWWSWGRGRPFSGKMPSVGTEYEISWASESVWTLWSRESSFALASNRTIIFQSFSHYTDRATPVPWHGFGIKACHFCSYQMTEAIITASTNCLVPQSILQHVTYCALILKHVTYCALILKHVTYCALVLKHVTYCALITVPLTSCYIHLNSWNYVTIGQDRCLPYPLQFTIHPNSSCN